jgi:hypothetical protein
MGTIGSIQYRWFWQLVAKTRMLAAWGSVVEGMGTMKSAWIAACFALLTGVSGAQAQTYPAHTVTVIVPFAAGGPADINS